MSSENVPNGTNDIVPDYGIGSPDVEWVRMQRLALLSGAVGVGVFTVMGVMHSAIGDTGTIRQFFLSYLTAWVFWLSLPVGCMALIGITQITGASWGVLLNRMFEASTRTLPLLALLFVPLAISVFIEDASPYPWSKKAIDLVSGDAAVHELQEKFDDWCNPKGFVLRAVIYFAFWGFFIYILNSRSARVEKNNDMKARRLIESISGPLLMFFCLGNMFASTDFVISIELSWFSTMFPVIYCVNQMLTSLCFCIAVFLTLSRQPSVKKVLRPKFQLDMGSFLLGLTMIWSYTSFAQFLLVWIGNLPEEIPFFLKRTRGGWEYAARALCVLHFALPFMLLLFRDVKLHPRRLRAVAIGIMIMCALDVLWWIEPVYEHDGGPLFLLMDAAAIVGMGGIWAWFFLGQLKRHPLLPTNYLPQLPGANHGH